jgi:hypothetical protein
MVRIYKMVGGDLQFLYQTINLMNYKIVIIIKKKYKYWKNKK